MSIWLIEPRDPLIVRDGRPFDNDPGARSVSLAFPFPSTVAGSIRTLAGSDPLTGKFQESKETIQRVKEIGVRGPLLAEIDAEKRMPKWLFPAPSDAVLFPGDPTGVRVMPLTPLELPPGAQTDMGRDWLTVGLQTAVDAKPADFSPRFWYWDRIKKWLVNPSVESTSADEMGLGSLSRAVRTHVGINPQKLTAEEGAIFQTAGLEFHTQAKNGASLSAVRDLALAVATDANLPGGTTSLGGERRLIHWQQSDQDWPICPPELITRIAEEKACRVILATPAHFSAGYYPAWMLTCQPDLRAKIRAAIVGRYQAVSGWDYENRCPKPSRRLAPSGSVYFLQLDGEKSAIESWIKQVWMQNISDDVQSRRDGFGLALIGAWNGKTNRMEDVA